MCIFLMYQTNLFKVKDLRAYFIYFISKTLISVLIPNYQKIEGLKFHLHVIFLLKHLKVLA